MTFCVEGTIETIPVEELLVDVVGRRPWIVRATRTGSSLGRVGGGRLVGTNHELERKECLSAKILC